MNRRCLPITCALILALCIAYAGQTRGQIYDYTALPDSGDTYTTALFRIYIPDTPATTRGIYFYVNPYNSDSRFIVDQPDFVALCQSTDCALMGAQLDSRHMETGIGNAVLRAQKAFAEMSEQPEIEFSPLFFDGFSWGGQFSYHFTVWKPERVIGFMTEKGGYHDTTDAGGAIHVPGYLFIAELDLPYRITNLTGIFERHRPLGALWILAMEPGGGHARITDRNLLDNYYRTVNELRLPAIIPPHSPVILNALDESDSWLGNRESFAIAHYDCYDASVDSACWFPSREVGVRWQVFVSDSTVTDTIPCDPTGLAELTGSPEAPSLRLRSYPNPFHPATTIDFYLPAGGAGEVAIYDTAGRLVHRLMRGELSAGEHSIRWTGDDASGRQVASGVYYCRLRADGRMAIRKVVRMR